MTAAKSRHDYSRANPQRSHTSRVMREIGMAIVSGRYPQNTILPGDTELLALFGVSRTVLREAIKTLAGKGLVQSKARIGTKVRERSEWNLFDPDVLIWHAEEGFDDDFIASLGEMRLALEPEAAALAARRRTPEQLGTLYRCLDEMAAPGLTSDAFAAADLDFHLTVANMAANPFLRSISTLIEVALVTALRRSWPGEDPGGTAGTVARHRAIADAIGRHDSESARVAMRVVIEEGIARSAGSHL